MDYKRAYIDMRNSEKYNLQFFFDYYLGNGGKVTDPGEFTETFLYTHQVQPTPPGFPEMKIRVGEIDRQAVLNHMDTVFGLTILNDKEGKFIKVIE